LQHHALEFYPPRSQRGGRWFDPGLVHQSIWHGQAILALAIDFLTFMDLERLPDRVRTRFF